MLPTNSKKKRILFENGLTNSKNNSMNLYTFSVGSRSIAKRTIVAKWLKRAAKTEYSFSVFFVKLTFYHSLESRRNWSSNGAIVDESSTTATWQRGSISEFLPSLFSRASLRVRVEWRAQVRECVTCVKVA